MSNIVLYKTFCKRDKKLRNVGGQERCRCFAKRSLSVNLKRTEAERIFRPRERLTSFIRHDDDDRFRPVSLRIEHAQRHQVLRVRLQPRQRVLLQRQKQNTWGK